MELLKLLEKTQYIKEEATGMKVVTNNLGGGGVRKAYSEKVEKAKSDFRAHAASKRIRCGVKAVRKDKKNVSGEAPLEGETA